MYFLSWIENLLADPRTFITLLLLQLPGLLLAMSAHEYAHARVAYRMGDNTAAMLGRLTINPLRHIDPLGFTLLLVAGFGWAKPVPVNPRNFKGDHRRCDLKVSLAGITMNLILFLLGALVLYAVLGAAFSGLPAVSEARLNLVGTSHPVFLTTYEGMQCVFIEQTSGRYVYLGVQELLNNAIYGGEVIRALWGSVPYYLFEILANFVHINLVLAIFNLLPVPPLDGYHVLNDLVLKRSLFASERVARICYLVLIVLLISGVVSQALGFVIDRVFALLGSGAGGLLGLLGVL